MAKRSTEVDAYVGRRVRQRRIEVGVSQNELAIALGISFQQIQKYENGSNRVSAGRLFEIAQRLSVSLDYFFDGAEPRAAGQPGTEALRNTNRQALGLVRNFAQISDSGTRTAVAGLVSAVVDAETAGND